MTEEEKIVETEKSREKYFYVDKEKTYQVLTGIATSFIGASLALLLFAALHKPPVPPCPMGLQRPMPCPMQMMMHRKHFGDFRGPQGHFQGHRKFPKEFRGKDFGGENLGNPFAPPEVNFEKPAPPLPKNTTTPKK